MVLVLRRANVKQKEESPARFCMPTAASAENDSAWRSSQTFELTVRLGCIFDGSNWLIQGHCSAIWWQHTLIWNPFLSLLSRAAGASIKQKSCLMEMKLHPTRMHTSPPAVKGKAVQTDVVSAQFQV